MEEGHKIQFNRNRRSRIRCADISQDGGDDDDDDGNDGDDGFRRNWVCWLC